MTLIQLVFNNVFGNNYLNNCQYIVQARDFGQDFKIISAITGITFLYCLVSNKTLKAWFPLRQTSYIGIAILVQ